MKKSTKMVLYVIVALLILIGGIYGYYFYTQPSIELNITKNTTVTTLIPSGQFSKSFSYIEEFYRTLFEK